MVLQEVNALLTNTEPKIRQIVDARKSFMGKILPTFSPLVQPLSAPIPRNPHQ